MPELTRLEGLLGKIEGTYKSDPTPVIGDDGIQTEESLHENASWGYVEENLRENLSGLGLGRAGSAVPSGRWMDLEVTTALKGRSTAFSSSNKPEMGVLFRACGFSETVDATGGSEKVTYALRSSGFESATVWAYSGSKLFKINGCRGNARFICTPGQIPRAVFSLRGYLASITQVSLPTIVYPAKDTTPPVVKNAGMTINGVDPAGFDDWELDMQTEVVDLPNGNDSDGFAGVYISDYNPQITTTIERAAISTLDPWTLRDDGTLFAWDIGDIGATQYNKVKISGPKGRIIDAGPQTSDGLAMQRLVFRAQHTDEESEDALTVVFS